MDGILYHTAAGTLLVSSPSVSLLLTLNKENLHSRNPLFIPVMPYFCLKITVLVIFTALKYLISYILAERSLHSSQLKSHLPNDFVQAAFL